MRSRPASALRCDQSLDQLEHRAAGGGAQHILHQLERDRLAGRGQLVEQGDGVAHGAGGLAGDQGQRIVLDLDLLAFCHLFQAGDDIRHRDAPELVALAAREHRGGYLVDFGGRQDEDGVGRRLLQRLQQGVESRRGEHVDFVDDIDLVTALVG